MQKKGGVVQSLAGRVVVGAVIKVFIAGTQTPATIFSNRTGSIQIADLKTDASGEWGFYAPNGRYDIRCYVNSVLDGEYLDELLFDPDDADLGSGPDNSGLAQQVTNLQNTVASLSSQVNTNTEAVAVATANIKDFDHANSAENVYLIGADGRVAQLTELAEEGGAGLIGTVGGLTLQAEIDNIKSGGAGAEKQNISEKDTSGGYPGLSGYNVRLKNSTGLVTTELATSATAGQTYTFPNKSGTVAMTSDITSGGSMVLLGSATVSTAVANIDFLSIFTSAYDKYVIDVIGIQSNVADTMGLRVAVSGAAQSGANYYAGAEGAALSSASSFLVNAQALRPGFRIGATINILGTNATDAGKPIHAIGGFYEDALSYRAILRSGQFGVVTGALTGFSLFWAGGSNFTAGIVRVYGVKNS